jgi:hypothetical protein
VPVIRSTDRVRITGGRPSGLGGTSLQPESRFKQLLAAWRSLPVDVEPTLWDRPARQRQRAEDQLRLDGVAQLVADHQAGRSTKWLQRTYGLSQGAVLRQLDVNGGPRRPRGLTDAQVQEAVQLYGPGVGH